MESFSQRKDLEPDDFYNSPDGYIIFTEKYLLKRGYCCQNGCKHCPYKKAAPPLKKGGEINPKKD